MTEKNLNFDEIVNRKGTDCLKYDFAKKRGMPQDVLPLWVADMDFKTSSYVEEALIERTRHGIFGYSEVQERYTNAVSEWMKKQHDWEVQTQWLIKTPGVVFALAMAVKAYTNPGDAVLIQQPVYYPFSEVIADNGRKIVSSDLYLGSDNRYHIDFVDFTNKIEQNQIKLFLLCNPQNPTGRVFTKDELLQLGEICLKHKVIVVSDEIHSDFVFQGKHTVFASLKKEYEEISVICTSASKTFNLASMLISNIFIPNTKLRRQFRKQVEAAGISQLSILGLVATQTAYEYGEEWYKKMLDYIRENIAYVKSYVKEYIPDVNVVEGEGTYLLWLDFRKLGIAPEELDRRIIQNAKLWLDSGKIFGTSGEGFQRINVATSRAVLKECLERIKKYVR